LSLSIVLSFVLVLAILLAVALILPMVSFVHSRRATRTADDLRRRLDALERKVDGLLPPTPARPSSSATERAAVAPGVVAVPRVEQPAAPPRKPPIPVRSERASAVGLEQVIGGSWLLYAGVAAVVLGMSYFVKFAFDNGWISEPLRVTAGGVIGVALVGMGVRFRSRGLALFGQALAGGGIVVLYLSIYAALHFYALVQPAPAFGLMATVTAGAAWLADRQRSQTLAALALVGGFATPLLVGGKADAQSVLFTYIAILIAGTAVVARRHAWPLLSAASYIGTIVLVVVWFFSSYEADRWLRTELFLTVYVCLFGYLLWALLRSGDRSPQAQLAAAPLVIAPLSYHLASVALLNQHPGPWLVYLVLTTVAGLIVAQRSRAAWLRVVVLLLVGMPALVWLQSLPYPRWYAPAVVTVLALYALHLAALWEATGGKEAADRIPLIDVIHAQLNALLLPLSLFVFLESRAAVWNPWMLGACSAWNAGLAVMVRGRAPAMTLQFIASSATLAAVALVLAFAGPVVAVGWGAEGVLVGWLALRERSARLGIGSGLLIAMGSTQLALLLAAPLPVGDMPILNSRALAAALVIGLLAWLAWRMREPADTEVRGHARNAVIVLANILMLALLSADIHAYFGQQAVDAAIAGERIAGATASLAEQLTLSAMWALYAVVLIAAGIRRRYAPARYLAIVVFAVTILKVLFQDIAGLDRLNRMLSVLVVGVLLLVASYLYQRMAAETDRDSG
jgi:uncharacterized membrane protein